MPQIPLTLDPNLKLFATSVTFFKNGIFKPTICVVDSGSEVTSITEELMTDLKITDADLSEKIRVAGVTGIGYNRTVNELDIILPINTKVVKVKNVAILTSPRIEKTVKKQGMKIGIDVIRAAVPNLLGLDFLDALKGTLHISYNSNNSYIEW